MKIISLELKSCDTTKGEKTNVLEMLYSIGKETWKALLKDYNPKDEREAEKIIRAFKKSVREANANRK